jgi:iron complex transport system permease protein
MKQKNLSGMSKILIMLAVTLLVAAAYTVFGLRFSNERLLHYQLEKRIPKLIVIALTAFSIGSASIVFQSVINNTIVTPCLLGMDALYTLVHTLVYFFAGAASVLVTNKQIAFSVDLAIMAVVGMVIYSYMFKKTGSNVLYVILIGTVLTSLFSSLQSTMTRMMDPNAYDTLLTTLVASFDNANTSLILFSAVVLFLVALFFWKDLRLLDALTLGKDKAVNLGIDYDRSIRRLLFAVTLYMTVATALVGPLAFLGLIIANLSRQLMQTYRHSLLISASVLFGMIVLLGGQFLVERIFSYNIPVSVFITTGGGIYFLYLLLVKRKPY